MTPFRAALTALAALPVPAVTAYPIEALPATLPRSALPALLVMPGDPVEERRLRERGSIQTVTFSGGARTAVYRVTHLLLVAPEEAAAGARSHLPALIDSIDAYTGALVADLTLGGALSEPARVEIEPGTFRYGSAFYYGCAFRHVWTLAL